MGPILVYHARPSLTFLEGDRERVFGLITRVKCVCLNASTTIASSNEGYWWRTLSAPPHSIPRWYMKSTPSPTAGNGKIVHCFWGQHNLRPSHFCSCILLSYEALYAAVHWLMHQVGGARQQLSRPNHVHYLVHAFQSWCALIRTGSLFFVEFFERCLLFLR